MVSTLASQQEGPEFELGMEFACSSRFPPVLQFPPTIKDMYVRVETPVSGPGVSPGATTPHLSVAPSVFNRSNADTVPQCLALLHHTKKVLGLNPAWSLHVLPSFRRVFLFPPNIKDVC